VSSSALSGTDNVMSGLHIENVKMLWQVLCLAEDANSEMFLRWCKQVLHECEPGWPLVCKTWICRAICEFIG